MLGYVRWLVGCVISHFFKWLAEWHCVLNLFRYSPAFSPLLTIPEPRCRFSTASPPALAHHDQQQQPSFGMSRFASPHLQQQQQLVSCKTSFYPVSKNPGLSVDVPSSSDPTVCTNQLHLPRASSAIKKEPRDAGFDGNGKPLILFTCSSQLTL